jgi:hypothetical protein
MPEFATDRPRPHHYAFAHRELPVVARRFAGDLAAIVRSGDMDGALAATWDAIGEHLPPDDRLPSDGLSASLHEVAGREVVIVTMPRVEHAAEAYLAGIVVASGELTDYFVLEHGWTVTDEPRTVMCKWDERGHVNLGDGPLPNQADFLAAIMGLLGAA